MPLRPPNVDISGTNVMFLTIYMAANQYLQIFWFKNDIKNIYNKKCEFVAGRHISKVLLSIFYEPVVSYNTYPESVHD